MYFEVVSVTSLCHSRDQTSCARRWWPRRPGWPQHAHRLAQQGTARVPPLGERPGGPSARSLTRPRDAIPNFSWFPLCHSAPWLTLALCPLTSPLSHSPSGAPDPGRCVPHAMGPREPAWVLPALLVARESLCSVLYNKTTKSFLCLVTLLHDLKLLISLVSYSLVPQGTQRIRNLESGYLVSDLQVLKDSDASRPGDST